MLEQLGRSEYSDARRRTDAGVLNVVADRHRYPPSDGWLSAVYVHAGGDDGPCDAQLGLWLESEGGSLIFSGEQQSWNGQREWRSADLNAMRVSPEQGFRIGYKVDPMQRSQYSIVGSNQHYRMTYLDAGLPDPFDAEETFDDSLSCYVSFLRNEAPLKGTWRSETPAGWTTQTNIVYSGTLPHSGAGSAAVRAGRLLIDSVGDPYVAVESDNENDLVGFARADDEGATRGPSGAYEIQNDQDSHIRARATDRIVRQGDAEFDYSSLVEVRVTRVSDGAEVYRSSFEPTEDENAQGYFSRNLFTLPAGQTYDLDYRHIDSFGLKSHWSDQVRVEVAEGPLAPVITAPSGKIASGSGITFTATHGHAGGQNANAMRVRIWNASGSNKLHDTTATLSPTVPVGGVMSVSQWFPALEGGRTYRVQVEARDTLGRWGEWTSKQAFRVNRAPNVPSKMSPSGAIRTSNVNLKVRLSDPDGDPIVNANVEVYSIHPTTRVATKLTGYPKAMNVSEDGGAASLNVVNDLTPGTLYQWRANASDGLATSSWTGYAQFTYIVLPTVTMRSPIEGGLSNLLKEPSAEYDPAVVGTGWVEVGRTTGKNWLTANQANIETDTSGFTGYFHALTTTHPSTGAVYVTRQTTEKYQDTAALKIDLSAPNETTHSYHGVIADGAWVSNTIQHPAGTWVVGSVWVKAPVGKTIRAAVRINRADTNAYVSELGGKNHTATGAWQRIDTLAVQHTAQAFKAGVTVIVAGTETFVFYADAFQLERVGGSASVPSSWEPGNTGLRSYVDRVTDGDARWGTASREAITDGAPGHYLETLDYITVDTASHYTLVGWFKNKSGSPASRWALACFNASNTFLGLVVPNSNGILDGAPPANAWSDYGGSIWPVTHADAKRFPTGTTKVKARWYPSVTAGVAGTVRFDSAILAKAPSKDETDWAKTSAFWAYMDADHEYFGAVDDRVWDATPGNSISRGPNVLSAPSAHVEISYSSPTSQNSPKVSDRIQVDRWQITTEKVSTPGGGIFTRRSGRWKTVYTASAGSNASPQARTVIPLPTNVVTNENRYRVKVWVNDQLGNEGETDWAEFDTLYDGPSELDWIMTTGDADRGELVGWHRQTLLDPNQVKQIEYRIIPEGGEPVVYVQSNALAERFVYPFPVSGVTYRVQVRQIQIIGREEIESKWTTARVSCDYHPKHFVKHVQDPERLNVGFWVPGGTLPTMTPVTPAAAPLTWGSKKPKPQAGIHEYIDGAISALLWSDDVMVDDEKRATMLEMIFRKGTLCLMTHRPAEKKFVALKENGAPMQLTSDYQYQFDLAFNDVEWDEDIGAREGRVIMR